MWNELMCFLLFVSAAACAQQPAPQKMQQLAQAIAKAEGYYVRGSIPQRCANPGDIKPGAVRLPGQVGVCKGGHARFRNDAAGWAALDHQIEKIVDGTSRYSVNMSISEVARRYAGNHRVWARNVSHNLKVTPETDLWEILDVPPTLVLTKAVVPDTL